MEAAKGHRIRIDGLISERRSFYNYAVANDPGLLVVLPDEV